VDDRPLREHRRRIVGVVYSSSSWVEVADVADDLALAVRQIADRIDLAQVECGWKLVMAVFATP
jgi:hypothetical protein